MSEWKHTENQTIQAVYFGRDECVFEVGRNGVSKINMIMKSGMHANIAYVQVWSGDYVLTEIPQHNTLSVIFNPPLEPR